MFSVFEYFVLLFCSMFALVEIVLSDEAMQN